MDITADLVLLSAVNFLHILATVVWIGGMTTNVLVLLPAAGQALEPPQLGRLLGAMMKRFRPVVYLCILVLLGTGGAMSAIDGDRIEALGQDRLWALMSGIKHGLTLLMILLAVVAFEVLARKAARLAADGPSPELGRLQGTQKKLAGLGFLVGMLVLLVTAVMTAIQPAG